MSRNPRAIRDLGSSRFWCSDEVYRTYGLSRDHLAPTYDAVLDAVHPDDRQPVREAIERSIAERIPYSLDDRLVRADGGVRVVHGEGEMVVDEAGDAVRFAGTLQDITERKRAEQELREAHHALERRVADRIRELTDDVAVRQRAEAVSRASEARLRAIVEAMQRFGQLESSTAGHEGTGLGLPLTKALVEAHGAIMDVDNAPGVGTSVRVRFPPERVIDGRLIPDP